MTRRRTPAVVWALLVSSVWCGIARGGDLPLPTAIRATPAPDARSASIRVTVANRSDRSSDPAILEVYLSLDGLVGPEDARLGDHAVLPLATRTDTAVALSAAIPDLTPGRYYVLALIRSTDKAAPPPPVHQTLWGAPLALGPDLKVEEVDGAVEGGSLRVEGRVANAGTRAVGPATVALALVERRTGAATRTVGSVEIGGLLPGAWTRFDATVVLPDAPAGRYALTAEVNPDRRVAESDGSNNTARGEREYPLGPDLTIAALSAAGSDAIVVSDAAANRGTHASGACGISFFLSRNGVLDATDVSLGYRVVPPLAAGAESRADTRLPLPRGLSTGRYYLLGKIDSSGAVAESDETNNVALAPDPLDLRLEAPRGKLREGFDAR
jgi:hypothetical protein